jgi:hypothetical protein
MILQLIERRWKMEKWTVSLGSPESPQVSVNLPAAISKSIRARGYNTAEVTVTKEGILVKPSKANKTSKVTTPVNLPNW